MDSIVGTIGAISDGMHYGWSAPYMPILQNSTTSHIQVTHSDESWLETIYLLGGLTGLPITVVSVERLGRKWSILMAAFISMVSWILIGLADDVRYLYAARFLSGISGDVAFVATPMYIAEIANEKIRGFLSGMIYIMMLVGILLIYSIAPYTEFYVHCVVGAAVVIFQMMTFSFVPDSPYYLVSKGKYEKAKKDLKRLRSAKNIDNEFDEITTAVKRQQQDKGRPQDLFLNKSNRKAAIILTTLDAAQHFSGISVILMNVHKILLEADSAYVSFEVAGIMFSAFMLIASITADCFVDKFGRKFLLMTSGIFSGLSILTLAIYFTVKNAGYDVTSISWIPIAAIMTYAAAFKFGMGLIPIVLTAELYPANIKAMGMTFADFSYLLFAFISVEMYQKLIVVYYYDFPFYIFACSTFLVVLFTWWYVPETKGRTLEEIQYILKGEPVPVRSDNLEIAVIKTVCSRKDVE